VVNASLLGLVEETWRHPRIAQLLGARFGIDGILQQDFIDLLTLDPNRLNAVALSPSSALGTSRRYVDEETLAAILKVLRSRGVEYLFYTGGNGSMGAAARIAGSSGVRVIGIPKTIDNDLTHTDHTPGYATAARFFACAARDIGADNRALPGQVEFIEVLGRNTGWLVAATALARRDPDDAPHLIYLPETCLPLARLLDDVDRVYRRLGRCVVTVCEGQLDESGQPFGADVRPSSGRPLAMNLAHRLATLVTEKLKLRARSEKPGLLARSGAAYFSQLDWDEARLVGAAAVRAAVDGASNVMITLEREPGSPYSMRCRTVPLATVASAERPFPAEWRNAAGNDVTSAFLEYAEPLLGLIERYPTL
ncbi:MAG TPA: diphosphate--fructose-6-phosphate 1-phosphotransferase, partial [Bryobacteraceae bacterium]|nr:diphosphate--fructose-6-phosphate 1-phosphotransferase [Bryobacteraceae bacterium]